ncbi:MAG: 7-cyano-7-deazaguanine synthase QueC [Hydrogenophilales bacterium 28-61-23]|nr:MAG: 7-cyano-7-deazaguanine synthase QueC [Hydrogenophilales bacterium 28-61-23]
MSRAVVLLSGGLDSATTLAMAKRDGLSCYALSLDYGQRHHAELAAASRVAQSFGVVEHRIMRLDMGAFGGSALTDASMAVPESASDGIPVTYVPARNTIMLALALGWAEVLDAGVIYIGVNALDYSGYPDCRAEFIESFQALANLATKRAVNGAPIEIRAPLIDMTKAEIVRLGMSLGVDYRLTVSCYQANAHGLACGRCDSCRLRRQGFEQAGIADPTRYFDDVCHVPRRPE